MMNLITKKSSKPFRAIGRNSMPNWMPNTSELSGAPLSRKSRLNGLRMSNKLLTLNFFEKKYLYINRVPNGAQN